ncbi:cytochrome c oxidase assembly protein ctaG-like [Acropora palmata]|uniref:cytochrome c oxidase assembly protein ctaG-like n=1 Tax=Acropora palmata TaxID=6131 RepID=UPI003DA1131C
MFWSLVRIGSPRTLTTTCPSRSHSVRLSGVLRLLSNRLSFNDGVGPQRRNICSTCLIKYDLPNRLSRGRDTLRILPTSGVFNDGRERFVGTSTDYNSSSTFHERNKTTAIYVIALAVAVMGFSYLAVPLYRLFCQATGLGGTVKREDAGDKIEQMERKPERELLIRFNADKSGAMRWNFKPQQTAVKVVPGETALAFYTATNPTEQAITGISTYNVIPFEAGQYFNKIQCFCFEEQRLNPYEQVDMPVFFYIDPEFTEDPAMAKVDTITLSYTFFEAKEAEMLGI